MMSFEDQRFVGASNIAGKLMVGLRCPVVGVTVAQQ